MPQPPSIPPSGGDPNTEALNQLTLQLYDLNSQLASLNSNVVEVNSFNVQFWQFDSGSFALGFSSVVGIFITSYVVGLIFSVLKMAKRMH